MNSACSVIRGGEDRSLFVLLPDEHARIRRFVSVAFTPRTVRRIEAQIREVVDRVAAPSKKRGGVVIDLFAEFTRASSAISLRTCTGISDAKRVQAPITTIEPSTDGSLENLRLLTNGERPTLAIVQYDTALRSIWGRGIYGGSDGDPAPHQTESRQLRRIATLHDEVAHILIRREALDRFVRDGCMPASWREDPRLKVLKCASVCLGPKESGVQVIAKAILDHHEIHPKKPMYLSVPDMVERLHGGDLDAGFFVSFVPSEPLKTLIDDPRIRLLSIDTRKSIELLNAGLHLSKIRKEEGYGSQLEGELDINTVATRAVLIAREDLPSDFVRKIARAVFQGAPIARCQRRRRSHGRASTRAALASRRQ